MDDDVGNGSGSERSRLDGCYLLAIGVCIVMRLETLGEVRQEAASSQPRK